MEKYTREDIANGLECWLNPDSDIWCENCAFCNEIEGGKCKLVILREAKKIIEKEE